MRKFTLPFSLLFFISSISFAQYATIKSDTLGTSANAYTTLNPGSTDVYADNTLNTVIFIHRNDNTKFENVTTHYRYDISKDGGQHWVNNIGPLNPNCSDSVGGYNSKFPQALIYNPSSSNTSPDSSYLAYLGSWNDNTSNSSNAIWDGIITGVERLDGASSTRTEDDLTMDNGNTLMASSLCKGLPGEFWAVDNEQSGGTNDSMIIVYKGVWDNNTKDVNWQVYLKLNPGYFNYSGTTNKLTPTIGFDPSGMNGWIGSSADFGGNSAGSYTPYFYRTADGGLTWNGPYALDMTTIPCIMNRVGVGNIPLAGFDLDMSVDKNGAPHFVSVVGVSDLNYSIGPPYDLYDFSYSVNSNKWAVTLIDTIYTFRGQIGNNGTEGAYTTDNRPQVSTTADGSKVLFLWSDSPTNAGGDNSLPDLLGQGYDANTGQWTATTDFTGNDYIWGQSATFPSVSPTALHSGSTTTVPVVITRLDPNTSDPSLPASFVYFQNINFDDGSYTVSKSSCDSGSIISCSSGTVYASSSSICDSSIVELTTTGSNGNLQWQSSTGGSFADIPGAIGNYFIDIPSIGYIQYRVVASSSGCSDTSSAVTVNVLPGVTASFSALVSGDTVKFTATSNGTTYQWDFGDGSAGSIANETHIYPAASVYYVCLTEAGGSCSFTTCEDVATNGASSPCGAFFYIYPDSIPHVWVLAYWATGVQPITYTWYWGDGDSTIAQFPTHDYDSAGYYDICLKIVDGTGCTTMFCDSSVYLYRGNNAMLEMKVTAATSTGVQQVKEVTQPMEVIPDPCSACAIKGVDDAKDILITDMLGRKINFLFSKTAGGFNIGLPNGTSGIYFVQNIKTGQVVRFVKE